MTVPFTGTYLSWIAKKSPVVRQGEGDRGRRGDRRTVDLYDAATLYQQSAWNSGKLTSGLHWVKIEWTGREERLAPPAPTSASTPWT